MIGRAEIEAARARISPHVRETPTEKSSTLSALCGVPVWLKRSGGGLAAGVAAAVKELRPSAHVIGVTMDRGAAMKASLEAGRPVQVEEVSSLAGSLAVGSGSTPS